MRYQVQEETRGDNVATFYREKPDRKATRNQERKTGKANYHNPNVAITTVTDRRGGLIMRRLAGQRNTAAIPLRRGVSVPKQRRNEAGREFAERSTVSSSSSL
jgi:hypothetical protein